MDCKKALEETDNDIEKAKGEAEQLDKPSFNWKIVLAVVLLIVLFFYFRSK
jgi:hypothetical protein